MENAAAVHSEREMSREMPIVEDNTTVSEGNIPCSSALLTPLGTSTEKKDKLSRRKKEALKRNAQNLELTQTSRGIKSEITAMKLNNNNNNNTTTIIITIAPHIAL